MDLNKVNEAHFNYSPPKKKEKKTAHDKNHPEQIHNTKNTPNHPTYWQSTVGIKNNKLSFKGEADEEIAREEFINAQLEEIKKQRQLNTSLYLDKDTYNYKNIMQELAPMGEQAVRNYTELAKLGISCNFSQSDLEIYNHALERIINKLPVSLDKKDLVNIFNFLANTLNPNNFQNKEDQEKLFDIFNAVMPLDNGNYHEKTQYLRLISERDYKSPLESANILSPDKTAADFGFFHQASEYIGECQERNDFFNMNLNPEEKKSVLDPFQDEDINTEDYRNFVVQSLQSWSHSSLCSINKIINTDNNKKQLFKRLIDKRTSKPQLSANTVLNLLTSEKDTKYMIELLDYIHAKYDQDKNKKTVSSNIIGEFIALIDSSNINDFKECSEHMPIDCAISLAFNCKNPVTQLFDKKLQELTNEFEQRGIPALYCSKIAKSCIDKMGTISPIAKEVVDIFFPKKDEGILNSIKRKFRTGSKKKPDSIGGDIFSILESLKNEEGEFTKDNKRFFYYLIKTNSQLQTWGVPLDPINEIMKGVKDQDGNLDRYKANIAIKTIKECKSLFSTANIFTTLSNFPKKRQRVIYDTCINLGQDNLKKLANFSAFAEYCFDEEGKVNAKRLEFIKKLVSINEIYYSNVFLELFDKYPKLENWLIELTKNIYYTTNCDYLDSILNKNKNEDGTISEDLQNQIFQYVKLINNLENFEELYDACKNENGAVDKALFNKVLDLIKLTYKLPIALNTANFVDIVQQNFSPSQINFKEKVNLLHALRTVKSYISQEDLSTKYNYIQGTIAAIESSLTLDNIGLPIDEKAKNNFIRNVIQSGSNDYELTQFEKIMTESIPLFEQMSDGLTLSYSRKEFLEDLSAICDSKDKTDILSKKTGITPIFNKDGNNIEITGYNGIIKLDELDTKDPFEKSVFDCMNKFMYDNKIQTGNTKLDEQLNCIIKAFPEFINIIGKKQHGTHAHTLDIHTLLVLAHSIENPDYLKELNQLDKSLLKLTAIFHDIMKQENVVDKGHQNLSSLYVKRIITKIIPSGEIVDRLYELIDNHHWSEEYSNAVKKEEKAQDLAFRFRRPNDFEIEKIIARADLMSVNPEFYERLKHCLSADNLAPIQNYLDFLYSTGNALFNNKILIPSKLDNHIEEKDGIKYKVINLHRLDDNADMSEFGFEPGLKKKDLKLLVHMVYPNSIYNSLNTVKLLSSPSNQGMLSESLISPKYKRTYCNRKYGVVLSQINTNILNEANSNQGSGTQKELSSIYRLIFNTSGTNFRENFKIQLLKNLGIGYREISAKEYGDFYKNVLASKSSISEISDIREFNLGKYTITGKQLKDAITKYQDSLIDTTEEHHNEIVAYTPKIQAVIAKSKNLNDVPDELLKFARENNYPVILI